jgi:putative secretion activating protein
MPEDMEKLMNLDNQKEKITSMSDKERFQKIVKYVLEVEGGYSNEKYDSGGKTTFGITEKEARAYGYKGDMRKLPKELAIEILKKDYYDKNRLSEVTHDGIALSIFDFALVGGGFGVRKAQEALNIINGTNLAVDGIMGEKTITALNKVDPEKFLKVYHDLQRQRFRNIVKKYPEKKKFLKGWLDNRMPAKEKFIEENMMGRNKESIKKGVISSDNLKSPNNIKNTDNIKSSDNPELHNKYDKVVKEKDKSEIYTENFEKAFKFTSQMEGGYTEIGGEKINYGITEEKAGKYGYKGNMNNIPLETVKNIYNKEYYQKNKLDKVKDAGIALTIFDSVIYGGVEGIKRAQRALNLINGNNNLAIDGIIGKHTLAELNNTDIKKFLKIYNQIELETYWDTIRERTPRLQSLFKDIVKRVNKREDYVEKNLRNADEKEIIKRIINPYGSLIKDKKEDKKTEKNKQISVRKNIEEIKKEFSSQGKTGVNENVKNENINNKKTNTR